jgi:hypothetical protein
LAVGSYVRSMLNFTSPAVNGSPLWKLTFGRMANCHVVGFRSFHSVASAG